jgi:hypothetical protein
MPNSGYGQKNWHFTLVKSRSHTSLYCGISIVDDLNVVQNSRVEIRRQRYHGMVAMGRSVLGRDKRVPNLALIRFSITKAMVEYIPYQFSCHNEIIVSGI